VQAVPLSRRGLSNSLLMTALGLGSSGGPFLGAALTGARAGGPDDAGRFLPALAACALLAALSAVALLLWGGQSRAVDSPPLPGERRPALREILTAARLPGLMGLIVAVSLLSGPLFQATNVYRPYRARDAASGLIVGDADHGWAALQSTGYVMQLVGGLLIGFVAGRRLSGRAVAGIILLYAVCALGIGLAPGAAVLFVCSGLFEFTRQFMRWAQTGYVAEHVADRQRPAAVAVSVVLSGLGGWLFNLTMRQIQSPADPGFRSWLPFAIAAGIGSCGAAWLWLRPAVAGGTSAGSPPLQHEHSP
jgi:hypothetical protein